LGCGSPRSSAPTPSARRRISHRTASLRPPEWQAPRTQPISYVAKLAAPGRPPGSKILVCTGEVRPNGRPFRVGGSNAPGRLALINELPEMFRFGELLVFRHRNLRTEKEIREGSLVEHAVDHHLALLHLEVEAPVLC